MTGVWYMDRHHGGIPKSKPLCTTLYEQAAIMNSAYTTSQKRLQAMRFQIQFCYFFYFSAINPLRVPALISTESSGRVNLSQLAIEKHESPPLLCE